MQGAYRLFHAILRPFSAEEPHGIFGKRFLMLEKSSVLHRFSAAGLLWFIKSPEAGEQVC
jgi:hypothetical protein